MTIVQWAVVGSVCCCGYAVVYPFMQQHERGCGRTTCLSNLKQALVSMDMYLGDFDHKWPLRDRWMDDIQPYMRNWDVCRCPDLPRADQVFGYAYNSWMAARPLGTVDDPNNTPEVYDSLNLAKSASDPFLSLPKGTSELDRKRRNVGFADSHARFVGPNGPHWRAQ